MGGGDANPLDQLNLNSALLNTGLTIQTGHSAAKKSLPMDFFFCGLV